MGQFSQIDTERINQVVLDANIRRFTVYETQLYIKEHLHIDISYPTVRNYRRRQRDSAQQWIAKLAKSKRADYLAQYKARIDEVDALQRKLWGIINNPQISPRVQVEAAGTLLHCIEQMISLYDCMPLVNAIRDFGCGYDHDNKDMPKLLYQQQQEPHSDTSDTSDNNIPGEDNSTLPPSSQ
jgi:hypothetical protein